MIKVSVGDIMTRHFSYVSPSASLLDCAKKLVKDRVDSLLILNGKKLVGIITSRDILWTITKKSKDDLKNINVMQIATKKVAVIKPSSDINSAFLKMKSLNFRRLPVLSKGEVIGIITLKDILRVDPSLYSLSGELVKIKEEEEKLRLAKIPWPLEGFCENCGAFAELLRVDSILLCPDCRNELY